VQGAGNGLQFAAQGGFPLLQQQARHGETGAIQNRAHHQQREGSQSQPSTPQQGRSR
jgi:hypothetical protein